MTPERALWQAVIHRALLDATATTELDIEAPDRRAADDWLRNAGRDFRTACTLAGYDPDFVADRYKAGRVDSKRLRAGRFGKKHLHGVADDV